MAQDAPREDSATVHVHLHVQLHVHVHVQVHVYVRIHVHVLVHAHVHRHVHVHVYVHVPVHVHVHERVNVHVNVHVHLSKRSPRARSLPADSGKNPLLERQAHKMHTRIQRSTRSRVSVIFEVQLVWYYEV
jgi:hypothetical protein